MRPRARNPRRTTRAEPVRNADAHNVRNSRVLILLQLVVVVVAVAVAVVSSSSSSSSSNNIVLITQIGLPDKTDTCQTFGCSVRLLDGGEQSNSESNKATSNRKPLFSKLFALWNDWLLCLTQANRATKSPPVRWDLLDHMLSLLFLLLPPDLNF